MKTQELATKLKRLPSGISRRVSKKQAVVFGLAFAILGTFMLLRSFAATPLVSVEPENSTLSGSVTVGSDANASGGKYIQFGGTSTGTGGTTTPPTGTAYYVDCSTGSDSNTGLSDTAPWKTIAKANQAALKPGESLLLKRGCSWDEQLNASWTGSSTSPITIGAYGTGNDPLLRRDAKSTTTSLIAMKIAGSYQVIDHIQAQVVNPFRDTTCLQTDGTGIPLGWYVGFSLSGAHNTLQNLDGSSVSVGVTMDDAANHNMITKSSFHDMHYLWQINKTSGALGSVGINLHGDDNEFSYNTFKNNGAGCTYADGTTQEYGTPFEVYNANRNYVHHNTAYGHRKNFEMGHDSTHTTNDNVLAYNLFVSDFPSAVAVNIHGAGNPYGPVNNTQIYHNTIVLTGAGSQGIVCSCSGGATIRNNIFVAESKSAYYSGTISESNNIYWDYNLTADSTADPTVQFSSASQTATGAGSVKADPAFVSSASDFHLKSTSPGVNKGVSVVTTDNLLLNLLGLDLDGNKVPVGIAPDIGAYEQ